MTTQINIAPAIERLEGKEPVEVNTTPVYATYSSGMYNGFYATEAEAIHHCENSEPQSWGKDSYTAYAPGELCAVVGNESVYASNDKSRYLDAIAGRWQMPFTSWQAP